MDITFQIDHRDHILSKQEVKDAIWISFVDINDPELAKDYRQTEDKYIAFLGDYFETYKDSNVKLNIDFEDYQPNNYKCLKKDEKQLLERFRDQDHFIGEVSFDEFILLCRLGLKESLRSYVVVNDSDFLYFSYDMQVLVTPSRIDDFKMCVTNNDLFILDETSKHLEEILAD